MTFEIEINNKAVKVRRGETILEVLQRIGIEVPTLCSMKNFLPTGMCRLCVVELEGKETLVPSCSFRVEEWMKIKTHSPRVVLARKTIIELLLANHPDDCLFCERNGNCELQVLAEKHHVRERRIVGDKNILYIDKSSVAIKFEQNKCILCGRCIRICNEIIGVTTFNYIHRGVEIAVRTTLNKPINASNCVFCGQCIMKCPTAALSEQINFSELQVFFHDPSKKMAVTYSPAVAATIAENYGFKNNKEIHAIIHTILKKIGFEVIFSTSLSTDIMIIELAQDFIQRLKSNRSLPLFTSCCPSWVKFIEQKYPHLIKHLSTTKSYHQLSGIIAKYLIAQQKSLLPDDIHLLSIMPCTARKFEATRPEMTSAGISLVDSVITTREFIRMINMYGINVSEIAAEAPDNYYLNASRAGELVNISNGTTSMFLRTINYLLTGNNYFDDPINIRNFNKPYKEFTVKIDNYEIGIAIVNGLNNAKLLLEEIQNGRKNIHFVEVMACPGGCIAGGGQSIPTDEEKIRQRAKFLIDWAENNPNETALQNNQLQNIYQQFNISFPSNYFEKFHTTFAVRDIF